MPFLNKNLNAIPTYLVDLSGNPLTGGGPAVGDVASGQPDSGNPVKMGGIVGLGSGASGQRLNLSLNNRGALYVQLTDSNGYSVASDGLNSDGTPQAIYGVNVRSHTLNFNGSSYDRARGDLTGTWVHGPQNTVDTSLSGTIAASGATTGVAFVNTARQEVINASTATLWARWGATPTVNGAGSFPISAGGSYSTDRTNGTLQLLSTAANQTYTVNRFA